MPICATLSIIAAGQTNLFNLHILSNKFAVFIGKISYPLYLWHWPLLSFAFIINGSLDSSTRLLRSGIVVLTFVLSFLTWLLVERPVRHKLILGKYSALILSLCMAIVAASGYVIWQYNGFPDRERFHEYYKIIGQLHHPVAKDQDGIKYAGDKYKDIRNLRFSDTKAKNTIAVIGDSHADAAFPGIAQLGKKLGYNTFLGGWYVPGADEAWPDYQQPGEKLLAILNDKPDIKKVFISTRGMRYITATDKQGKNRLIKEDSIPLGLEKFEKSLQDFVNAIHAQGKRVYIIAENPELNTDEKNTLARRFGSIGIKDDYEMTTKEETMERQEPYLKLLGRIQNATIIPVIDKFCEGGICRQYSDDKIPLYHDDDHLSEYGSLWQAEEILKPYLMD